MTLNLEHKARIHATCLEKVGQQIADAQAMIDDAEDAIHNDTKSSAGDKYETGR
ncbi:MAG TPA: 3-oxoacyl-ACP synthase, partial [Bacteroidetes bacterium]|nr:3-oxoacyl-ACP synthase [Bacteroidota bacterium]